MDKTVRSSSRSQKPKLEHHRTQLKSQGVVGSLERLKVHHAGVVVRFQRHTYLISADIRTVKLEFLAIGC